MVSFSSNKTKSKSTPVDMNYEPFQTMSPAVANRIKSVIMPEGLSGVPGYEGRLYAPITAREESVLGKAVTAGTQNPFLASSNRLLEDTIAGRYVDPGSNPFLTAYIRASQRPLQQAFEESTLGDRATFTNAGQNLNESSPYARARAIANRGLADAMGDVSTKIGTAVYDRERQIQAAAPTQASDLQTAELARNVQALSAAGLPRLIEEQGIERGLDIYKQRLAALQNILGLSVTATRPVVAQESSAKGSSWGFGIADWGGAKAPSSGGGAG